MKNLKKVKSKDILAKSKNKIFTTQRGITLIALVITIIILLILAAITIAALSGDNGILSNAAKAKEETEKAEIIEQIRLDIYGEISDNQGKDPTEADIERIADEYGDISGTNFEDKILTTEKGNYEIKLSDIWSETSGSDSEDPEDPPSTTLQPGETATAEKNEYYDAESDKPDVPATVPVGFTVSNVEGEKTINGGLVIYYIPEGTEQGTDFWTADRDSDGILNVQEDYDQYVWIPVDGVLWDEGTSIEDVTERGKILLGRYVFKEDGTVDTTEGTTPTTQGGQLKTSSTSSYYYTEDTTGKGNVVATGEEGINSFIQSVRENGGYYIARYEAGDANATATADRGSSSPKDNPLVVKSGQYVYNNVNQSQASNLCQNLYSEVNSDLVNSYAWDTAILFIQKYSGDTDYSRQTRLQSTLAKTGEATDGENKDVRCNIYDMAGNCWEWTTETFSYSNRPCVHRGGYYFDSDIYTSDRGSSRSTSAGSNNSFRPLLYL